VCNGNKRLRKLKNLKPTEPTIILRTKEDRDLPQQVGDARVWADVAEPVEQGESRHTTLDINRLSLTNDGGTDGRPETRSDLLPKVPNEVGELRELFKELSESNAELNRKVEKVSFPQDAILTWLTS